MSNTFIPDKQMYNALHAKYICLPELGLLINKKTLTLVGTLNTHGYITTSFQNKTIGVHKIIFCMYHGYIPETIDHINRNKADNKIDNLREISVSGNAINTDVRNNKPLGIKGVNWDHNDKRWLVSITFNKKRIHIGSFKNFINAVKARSYAEEKLGYDEYDVVSSAKKYLMWENKFSFSSNITIKKEEKYNKNSVENEWNFFCLDKKQKIDKLIKK